jgi:ComF family protein
VCGACIARFAPDVARCPRCALPGRAGGPCGACLRDPPPFEHAVAALDYGFPWDALVAAFKFRDALDLGPALARAVANAVRTAGVALPSLVVPVPLGRLRLRERGYNQAWELARRVGRELGLQADAHALARHIDTRRQLELPLERRLANVRGSFEVAARDARRVRGRCVALVDDVMTTGATAREAARTLLDAGARSVQVWVAARTPAPA